MAADQATLHELLASHSTEKYDIEYGGFLSNHLAHGIIALYKLGASKQRLDQFVKWYIPKLEEPKKSEEGSVSIVQENVGDLLGKRVAYYRILNHYESLLSDKYDASMDGLIMNEFPKLLLGMSGSALHGMIHLGYGYSVRNPRIVCEGLAYLHHSYRPLVHSGFGDDGQLGRGQCSILTVLGKIRADQELFVKMMEEAEKEEFLSLKLGGFQRRLAYLLQYKGDYLVNLMKSLEIPNITRKQDGDFDVQKLGTWLVDVAITAYLMYSRKNDFFLLHGVTCAWSLSLILPMLGNYQTVLNSVRTYICTLLGTYMANGAQELNIPIPEGPGGYDWDEIVMKALDMETDEHIYKLVQVCIDMKNLCLSNENLYYQAAIVALKNKLNLFKPTVSVKQ